MVRSFLVGALLLSAIGCVAPSGSGTPHACGARAGDSCAPDEFCSFSGDAICGAGDVPGVCVPRPEICTHVYDPVCGCDGKTYANECAANAEGTSKLHEGSCDDGPEERECGGVRSLPCEVGEYCSFAGAPDTCGRSYQTGVCRDVPIRCTREYNPVCGCDGVTYNNACEAAAAGVNVAADRECDCRETGCSTPGEACTACWGAYICQRAPTC